MTIARRHLRTLLVVIGLIVACAYATMPAAGANAPIDLTLTVASQTTLDMSGCSPLSPNVTQFGTVLPGTTAKTGRDCLVTFGSSNESSSLRVAQTDGTGTALAGSADTWSLSPGSSTNMWRSVSSAGGTTWALVPGAAYRSLDNGLTWPVSSLGMGASPRNISVPTATSAWVATGTNARRTINATAATPTWNNTTVAPGMPDVPGLAINGVAATSATNAWVVGDGGYIRSTTDGGATNWTNIPSGTTNDLEGIHRTTANRVAMWTSSSNFLLTTIDNGASFKQQTLSSTYGISDVWMLTDDIVIVARAGGALWRTTNNTATTPTWTSVTTDVPWNLGGIWFTNSTDGWIAGDYGILLRTTDAGASWTKSYAGTNATLLATTSAGAGSMIVVGGGSTAMVSTNDGGTWNETGPTSLPTYIRVSMTYDGTGWRAGSRGAISRTTNGGAAWTSQTSGTTNDLFDVHAVDPQRAVAVGRNGTIIATTDGGSTWSLRTSNTTEHLYGVDGDRSTLWAVGEGGTLLKSVDAGWTWSVQMTVPGTALHTVAVVSPTVAVAFGTNLAYRTSDGVNWTSFSLPVIGSGTVTVSFVVPETNAIVYARSAALVRSLDNGVTWSTMTPVGTLNGSRDVAFSSPLLGYAAGNGLMRRTVNGGATWTNMSGGVTSYWNYGLDASERNRIISVGAGSLGAYTNVANAVPDYLIGSNDWAGAGTGAFAMCLRATTVTASWTANGTCDQSADGPHWRAVPALAGPTSEVVSSASAITNAEARFRFGVRLPPAQAFGNLYASITFVVIAPDV